MELKCTVLNTVDTKEIQKLLAQAAVNIMVGFPSGMRHEETKHKNDNGKGYKGYKGEDPGKTEPVDTAELATALHFGTALIPARPFLEDGIRAKETEIRKAIEEQWKRQQNGGKANWDKVGSMAAGAIDEFVRGDYYKINVPNSQDTIDYKGSDTPLIDGGNLLQSLQYFVQEGTE